MANRYSDIRRGAQLKTALDNYVTYLQTPRAPKVGTRGARKPTDIAYVVPFNFDLATDQVVPVRVREDALALLGPIVNNAATNAELLTTLGSKEALSNAGFKPAKVNLFQNTSRSVTVEKSDVTQREYLKYAGETFACPFGRKTATDDQLDCFNAIRGLILARTNFAIQRVSLQVEKYSAR